MPRCDTCLLSHDPDNRHERTAQIIERQKRLQSTGWPRIRRPRLDPFEQRVRRWAADQKARRAPADADAIAFARMLFRDPCAYCGTRDRVTIDHIVSISAGGETRWWNLTACCVSCNNRKNASTPLVTVYRMRRAAWLAEQQQLQGELLLAEVAS